MTRDLTTAEQDDGREDDGDNPLRAPAQRMPATRRKPGRSLTAAERHANGLALVQGLWLPAELVSALDAECERRGLRRTALVRTALEEWLSKAS